MLVSESFGLDVVTGAFGYTGRYVTQRLLAMGHRVRTLTGHPNNPNPFGAQVEVAPYDFDRPDQLTASLRGVTTLYNTYWIRFARGTQTFEQALANSRALIDAACAAGVRRIVHVSIANPSAESPLPYYSGKAAVEKAIAESGLSYAIVRPTVLFGGADVLINNIAWMLRRLPVFGIMGRGDYRIQPVCVEDLAELLVAAGQRDGNEVFDAVGPEAFVFSDLIRLIRATVRSHALVVHLPPWVALLFSRLAGLALGDVILTADEVKGLMGNLLVSAAPPTGCTRLSDWLARNAGTLGARYASELQRHFK